MPVSPARDRKGRSERAPRNERPARTMQPNPGWYAPVMVGLMILGLLWIVAFYLSEGQFPLSAIGNWNLVVGFGLIITGFIMTTNWR